MSGRSTGFHAFAVKFLPFLLIRCPAGGNLHYRWDKICRCDIDHEVYIREGNWWKKLPKKIISL